MLSQKLLLLLLDNYWTKPKISNFFRLIDFKSQTEGSPGLTGFFPVLDMAFFTVCINIFQMLIFK